MASVVEEEPLAPDDILRMLDEASQVRALNRQLESLDRLKDDFMSSVTHELRTPLTSIRAFAELMRDDPQMDTEQRQQFLGLVVAEAERLSRLVNQVLDMAKIESGHAQWRHDSIDLRELGQRLGLSLRRHGLRPEHSRTPHMTLVYDGSYDVRDREVEALPWTASELLLVLSPQGLGRHEQLGSWPLGREALH